jgi:hypothetical protein
VIRSHSRRTNSPWSGQTDVPIGIPSVSSALEAPIHHTIARLMRFLRSTASMDAWAGSEPKSPLVPPILR